MARAGDGTFKSGHAAASDRQIQSHDAALSVPAVSSADYADAEYSDRQLSVSARQMRALRRENLAALSHRRVRHGNLVRRDRREIWRDLVGGGRTRHDLEPDRGLGQ